MLTYPLVLVASVLGATFDPVGVTAREAMLPDVAKRANLDLERVNGVHEAVWGLAWLIGPGVAGLLISTVGAEASFWAMFLGFALSALLVGTACMPTPPPKVHSDKHWFADGLDGLRFVWSEPAIRSTAALSTITFTLVYSVVGVVLPVVYERLDQPRALGVLFMVFSGAGIVGALAYSAFGKRLPRRLAFTTGLASGDTRGGGLRVLASVLGAARRDGSRRIPHGSRQPDRQRRLPRADRRGDARPCPRDRSSRSSTRCTRSATSRPAS